MSGRFGSRRGRGPSTHLTWDELACDDEARTPYPQKWLSRALRLGEVFEYFRTLCGGVPLTVSAGFRTISHQRGLYRGKKRKVTRSQHCEGRAIDIHRPRSLSLAEFHARARLCAKTCRDIGGVGYYPWGVHLDIRRRPKSGRLARWGSRAAKKLA